MSDKPIAGQDPSLPYDYRGHVISAEIVDAGGVALGGNQTPLHQIHTYRFYIDGQPNEWRGTPSTWADVKRFLEGWADQKIDAEIQP